VNDIECFVLIFVAFIVISVMVVTGKCTSVWHRCSRRESWAVRWRFISTALCVVVGRWTHNVSAHQRLCRATSQQTHLFIPRH